jgi:hypothetical protein
MRELEDFEEIYPQFTIQRERLITYVANQMRGVTTANEIFQMAVLELKGTGQYISKTDEEIAREAMRVILKWMDDQGRE